MMRDDIGTTLPDNPALHADPLADATMTRILGRDSSGGADTAAIAIVNRELARWQLNSDLDGWRASPGTPEPIAAALEDYIAQGRALPAWADAAQIARAEALFMDISMASCTLLFCASLPQCYVMPDLSAVLHVAGQLEQHTDYRVRATAAMIFPVMMRGGLTDPAGGGVAQALKVRLIHATIRHLILRGDPSAALVTARPVPRLPQAGQGGMYAQLFAHGWDIERRGLPCNQQELAYTLLTFSYVFLEGLRRLGPGTELAPGDEEAYLHTWNVLGHVLGIERGLMVDTMDAARLLFARFQAEGRLQPHEPDPRPALAADLVATMQRYIPLRILKPFPVLLTRHLIGSESSRDLGLDGRVSWISRFVFVVGRTLLRVVDGIGRLFFPGFSIARLITRILGYNLTVKLLMDETRPLKLPDALLNEVDQTVRTWHNDVRAPRWVNAVERRFTGRRPPTDQQG